MAVRKKGKIWHYYWREAGKVRSITLGTEDEAEARRRGESIATQRRAALAVRRYRDALRRLSPELCPVEEEIQQGITLESLLPMAKKRREIDARTEAEWRRFCQRFPLTEARSITAREVLAYLDERSEGGKPKTFNNLRARLSCVFRFASVEAGISNPVDAIPSRAVAGSAEHYRAFSREETERLLASLEPHWHCLAMISLHTGLRLESCRRLSPEMVKDGIITIMPGKTARFGRSVRIPVSAALAAFLSNLTPKNGGSYASCFPAVYHAAGNKNAAYFVETLRRLGITDTEEGKASFHSLRATFVTRCREAGMRDDVLRGIVGHTSLDTTDLYSHDTASAVSEMQKVKI